MWPIISWIACIFSLFATILNVKKKKVCFLIWIVTALAFVGVNIFHTGDYAQALLFCGFAAFDAWGYLTWRRDEANKKCCV